MTDPMITRPTLVGKHLALMFPDGVPADAVDRVPRISALLDAAVCIARGQEPAASLAVMFAHGPVDPVNGPAPQKRKPPRRPTPESLRRLEAVRAELRDLERTPHGLVPARTIGLVLRCDPHEVSSAAAELQVDAPWRPQHGPASEGERWCRLLDQWGVERAVAWFEAHQGLDSRTLCRRFKVWATVNAGGAT